LVTLAEGRRERKGGDFSILNKREGLPEKDKRNSQKLDFPSLSCVSKGRDLGGGRPEIEGEKEKGRRVITGEGKPTFEAPP